MDLKTQLQRIKKDGFSVSQYLSQIKDITDKFSVIGEPISYRDHLAHILNDLGSEYNAFVTSIQNCSDSPALEDVRSLLLAYEAKLEKQNSVDQLTLAQANFASLNIHNNSRRSSSRGSTTNFPSATFVRPPFNPLNLSNSSVSSSTFSPSLLSKPQS